MKYAGADQRQHDNHVWDYWFQRRLTVIDLWRKDPVKYAKDIEFNNSPTVQAIRRRNNMGP